MYTDLRLKVRNFIRKYKKWVFIILIAFGIVIAINSFIKNHDYKEVPSTTYEPYTPIMGGNTDVDKKVAEGISNIIEQYVEYCNEKEYKKAYDLLSTDCKENEFLTLERFKEHVNNLFPTRKVYTLQNYYNTDDTYVYRLRIFDDILATGLTGVYDLEYTTEIVTLKEEKGNIVLSVNGYIGKENIGKVYEDQYIKITVESKNVTYETETYEVTLKNKTQYVIAVLDNTISNEIVLKLNTGTRSLKGFATGTIVLRPNQERNYSFNFSRYYHETDLPKGLNFANIRVLRRYPPYYDENNKIIDAVDEYGVEINF